MVRTTQYHVDFNDLNKEIKNYDIESEFMDCYQPCSECSIYVVIPTIEEMKMYDWEYWQTEMFDALLRNGFYRGDGVYIDVDY